MLRLAPGRATLTAMPSLFRASDAQDLLARVQRLEPNSKALWGKMNPAQMLAHCQVPLGVATGELRLGRSWIGVLLGWLAKRQLLADKPFGKNLPTAAEFRADGPRDFARERAQVVTLIEKIQANGAAGLTAQPHPFFGKLSVAQWEALMWKHLDHHLRQFGV